MRRLCHQAANQQSPVNQSHNVNIITNLLTLYLYSVPSPSSGKYPVMAVVVRVESCSLYGAPSRTLRFHPAQQTLIVIPPRLTESTVCPTWPDYQCPQSVSQTYLDEKCVDFLLQWRYCW